jgi:hypothetical protein
MALINALKFDRYSGAVLTDEEYFIGGRRRVQISDTLQSLITEEMSNEFNLEVVFGGSGNISFNTEVITKIKKELDRKFQTYKRTKNIKDVFSNVPEVAKISFSVFQNVIRDKVNKKLYGLFGFNIDDFNRGYYFNDQEKIEIKDEKIISKAMSIITNSETSGLKNIFDNSAVIIGTDSVLGYNAFDFYGGTNHLYVSTSLYEALGAGSTATSLSFSNMINSLTLDERRNGFDRVFGLVELIRITNDTAIKNNEVGGYYNIVYLNGMCKTHNERFVEISGDRSQLAKEIVGAFENNFISKNVCYNLIEKLIFSEASVNLNEIEHALMKNCKDKKRFKLYLRGYKV